MNNSTAQLFLAVSLDIALATWKVSLGRETPEEDS